MGNHAVGGAMAAAADVFWQVFPAGTTPTKERALAALEASGNRFRGADAEFDDHLMDWTTPLGRLVAIAFDAQPDELRHEGDNEFDEP